LGRGGAEFPTALKWKFVKNAKSKKKYIVCNGAEGEEAVFKDGFILENYPKEVVFGVKLALDAVGGNLAYIYLNKNYYKKFKTKLEKIIGGLPIKVVKESGGYLAGEETALCEAIEGKRVEPRIKPPFPAQAGSFNCPTLINNVETFYCVSKIAKNEYKNTRFYSVSGDVKNPGVYELPTDYSIEKALKETGNYPELDFFIQVGGGSSGEILLPSELVRPVCGAGAIIVYDKEKTNPILLMKKWADFFTRENCDKCVPCREGIFRIAEMLSGGKINRDAIDDILFTLKETSFCALGKSAVVPFESLLNKVMKIK
jgi:NADH:ubiquinone oxidoreductase subunit F (NADH-binding)